MFNQLSVLPTMSNANNLEATQFCTLCGFQNSLDASFCLNCAATLGSHCSTCGQAVPGDSNFCPHCGAQLSSAATGSARLDEVHQNLRALMPQALVKKISATTEDIFGERREVTVINLSLKQTTAEEPLDDETAYFLKEEALQLLVEIIYKYEGTIDKFTGDGLVALFGAPVAHEDDPERAVRAVLEMQAQLQTWQTQARQIHGASFKLRAGLNTGPVITGKIGNNLHMDYTAIGETVNLASHLEMAAEPGTVMVSIDTYHQTQSRFEYKTLPLLAIDWLPEPVQVFQPLTILPGPKHQRASWPGYMIGRADELARLQTGLTEVCQKQQSRVAVVTGEAGLGKSRLVAEFRRTFEPAKIKVHQATCLSYAYLTSLWTVAALLRNMMQLSQTAAQTEQLQMLQAYLHQQQLDTTEILPYLAHLLGLAQSAPQIEARLALLDATMLQRQTHAALRQVFLAEARSGPTVIIFEDLHWLDPASKDFLDYLIQTTDHVPLMLVLVSRQAERETTLRSLLDTLDQEPDRLIDIQLQLLSESEGQLLADQFIQQSTPEAWGLKTHIVKRAAGNPFYVEEVIRMLIDQGGLVRDPVGGGWQVTQQASELLKKVPKTVRGLVLARFDRLPETVRRTLQKVAAIGVSFPVSLLQTLNKSHAEILATHLDELQSRQFLKAHLFRSEPGYTFWHALTQETIYTTLIKRDRRKIHGQIAEAIAQSSLWLTEEKAEVLAHHYSKSTTPAKAIPHLIIAGDNASRRCAYETAITHYRKATTLLPDVTNNPGQEYFQIGIGLANALKFVGEFAEASQILSELLQRIWRWGMASDSRTLSPILAEILRQLADVRQREGHYEEALTYLETGLQTLGQAAEQEYLQIWYSLLDRMAWIRFRQGALEEASRLAHTATHRSTLDDNNYDPISLASLYNTLGGCAWQQGALDQAIGHVERSLQLYENVGYLWGMAIAYGNLGILYYNSGNWHRAADYYEQAYAVQQVIGSREGQAIGLDNLGILHMAMGDHKTAKTELAAGLSIRQRLGDVWGTAQSHANLARLHLIRNEIAQASTHAHQALKIADKIGSSEIQIEARWIMALIKGHKGTLPAAFDYAREALEMARSARLLEKEINCLRVFGTLHARAGQYHQAEDLLRYSIDLTQKQNDPYHHGLALLALGRVYQQKSSTQVEDSTQWQARAKATFSEALAKFRDIGAIHDLKLAQAALAQFETTT